MNKIKFITLLISIILLAGLVAGCTVEKTAIADEQFTEYMQNAGFSVENITDEIQSDGLVTSTLVAEAEDGKYQIQFWTFEDWKTASDVFNSNMNNFDEAHSVQTMSLHITGTNYNYYSSTADGTFFLISSIDNTMLYCKADSAYKKEISGYAKELGYK